MRLRGRRCCSRAMVQSKKNCNVGSTKQSNNNSNKLHILIFIEDWSMKYTAHKSTTGEHSALVGKLENYNFPFLLCSYNFLYIMLLCFGCFFFITIERFSEKFTSKLSRESVERASSSFQSKCDLWLLDCAPPFQWGRAVTLCWICSLAIASRVRARVSVLWLLWSRW